MKYSSKYVVEVHKMFGVRVVECESFWDAMSEDINYFRYSNIDQAKIDFDEVPEELNELLKNGSVIEIDGCFYLESEFDKEDFAISEWRYDGNLEAVLTIESKEDAEWLLKNYNGKDKYTVREEVEKIIKKEERK